MRIALPLICLLLIVGTTSRLCFAQETEEKRNYPDPARFEEQIRAFELADEKEMPSTKAIVCIGSSSIRGWHGEIYDDLAPLSIVPRGFGGSTMNDALHYAERIVLAYRPRAILLYEGDNDIALGIEPQEILETFQAFVAKIHASRPKARIYFLSIKPSIKRWEMWPKMQVANSLIAEECSRDERLIYIDVASAMLGEDGEPRTDIFKEDDLHMNRSGYKIWRDEVRPVLIKAEWPHE